MNRDQLRQLAQETIEISRAGRYLFQDREVVFGAARPTELWTSQALDQLVQETQISQHAPCARFEVRSEGTVDAIFRLADGAALCPQIGVLNFASAKNPGGGFQNGSMAQEECLAFCSNLYQTQTTGQGPGYYEINRANRDPVYTDTMLIGDVTFFRTGSLALAERGVLCPVITAPAVNMGVVVRNGDSVPRAQAAMKNRMRKLLCLFARWGCTELILGAYGCGVFRNRAQDVAQDWEELLVDEGYGRLFQQVTFSILERPGRGENTAPFLRRFGKDA